MAMSRREFNRMHAAALAEYAYVTRQNLPIWEIMSLEDQGILRWRFRPPFIQQQIRSAISELKREQL